MVLILKQIRKLMTEESQKLKERNRQDRRAVKEDNAAYERIMARFQHDSELQLEECVAKVLSSISMQRQEFDDIFTLYGEDQDVKEASMLLNTPEE